MKKKSNPEIESNSSYSNPEQFVAQFAMSLVEHLENVYDKDEHHIVDYAATTSVFADAFYHIVNNFS